VNEFLFVAANEEREMKSESYGQEIIMRHFRVHCELSNVLQMMMMIMILTNDQSAKPSSSTRREQWKEVHVIKIVQQHYLSISRSFIRSIF